MILRHNFKQIALGLLCLVGSLLGYIAAWYFFRYVPHFIAFQFGFRPAASTMAWTAAITLLLITVSGYRVWKNRGGFHGYHESSFFHDLGESSASGMMIDHYAHRVTGAAYVLSQLFLAGPLLAIRAFSRFRNFIVATQGLEERLLWTLDRLRQLNKWQNLNEHPDLQREILLLAQMREIDFSIAKGQPRIRAWKPNGV